VLKVLTAALAVLLIATAGWEVIVFIFTLLVIGDLLTSGRRR